MQSQDISRPLDRAEAAQYLRDRGYRVSSATLAKLAVVGGGPNYIKFGRRPLYATEDLLDWVETRTTRQLASTSHA